eukprot:scaffold23161_cov55-Attheya_sp.AAC.2
MESQAQSGGKRYLKLALLSTEIEGSSTPKTCCSSHNKWSAQSFRARTGNNPMGEHPNLTKKMLHQLRTALFDAVVNAVDPPNDICFRTKAVMVFKIESVPSVSHVPHPPN